MPPTLGPSPAIVTQPKNGDVNGDNQMHAFKLPASVNPLFEEIKGLANQVAESFARFSRLPRAIERVSDGNRHLPGSLVVTTNWAASGWRAIGSGVTIRAEWKP